MLMKVYTTSLLNRHQVTIRFLQIPMQMVIVGSVIQATIKMVQSVVAFLQTLIQITIAIIGIAALAIAKVEIVV